MLVIYTLTSLQDIFWKQALLMEKSITHRRMEPLQLHSIRRRECGLFNKGHKGDIFLYTENSKKPFPGSYIFLSTGTGKRKVSKVAGQSLDC